MRRCLIVNRTALNLITTSPPPTPLFPPKPSRISCTDGGGSVDLKEEHESSSSVLENTSGGYETKSSPEEEEEEEGGTSGSHAKPLKKPTKILPCPRCNSSDTKFCYFNNNNVNQPRHLCKKCQRYWTAGGTVRSMVIGTSRRKSKSYCSSQQSYVTPFRAHPDGLLTLREDSNDRGANQDARNTASDSASISLQSFATHWPNPWSPAHQSSSLPPPAGFVPIYAVPPYWSCGALAWIPPASALADQRPYSLLGKHPRDNKRMETKVLVPKTLRFDDPRDAAQSSIWTTLGIKNDKGGISIPSGAFFSGFQPKDGETTSARLTYDRLLQANPAALARSFAFHECA